MPTGIRGANPIWSMVNLWGKLFDDTYYMYVLENQIPYIPADVFQDPDLNVVWSDPIQFYGNGTLPNNIYYEPNTVYRLEFRQNNGLSPPSQSDPLIYLVENYSPLTGSGTVGGAGSTSNQITNPQFALINFTSPYSYTGAAGSLPTPGVIKVAPGWFLNLTGSGSVTIKQVPLNNDNLNPSNAPYALQLTLTGWTSVYLSQRFQQNGMLWANQYVSSAITAALATGVGAQNISAQLVDSNGTILGTILTSSAVVAAYNQFAYVTPTPLPASTNPDVPPEAYIEYQLLLPSSIDVYLTSIQVAIQSLPIAPNFNQDSINRQIDQTYNTAYPIVPVGTVIPYMGFTTPQHYLFCDGTAYNRSTYDLLFQTLSTTESVTLTSGMNTFTVSNPTNYYIGMDIEGVGIAASTTITNIVSTTVTMSNNATASGASTVRFFIGGNGDGSTTFNVPDLRGYVLAGAYGSLFVTDGPGAKGGASTITLTAGNLPAHVHAPGSGVSSFAGQGSGGVGGFNAPSGSSASFVSYTGNNVGGTATPFNNVQPTTLTRFCIRYE